MDSDWENYSQISIELCNFCTAHKKVFLYGAGVEAKVIGRFLECEGFVVDSCIVSYETKGAEQSDYGYKIISIFEYKEYHDDECGIVISLPQKYHFDVKNLIKEVIGSADICLLMDDDIETIDKEYHINKCKKLFCSISDFDNDEIKLYENKIKQIRQNHSFVEVLFWWAETIAFVAEGWVYICEEEPCDGIFRLYYPATPIGEELSYPNKYLLNKCESLHAEMLSLDKLRFWAYFYQNHPVVVRFSEKPISKKAEIDVLNRFIVSFKDLNLNTSYIYFSEEEISKGEEALREMGIDGEFVCFAIRDSAYYSSFNSNTKNREDVDLYRNSDIETYKDAIEGLERYNLTAVRMGAIVEKPLHWKNTVDYAYQYRSEFMDLFLISRCNFFICNTSGIQAIANLFSKRMVVVNFPFFTTRNDLTVISNKMRDLCIPKKFYSCSLDRYLFLKEIIGYETNNKYSNNNTTGTIALHRENNVKLINNTSNEIKQVVDEAANRWCLNEKYEEEDEIVQDKYQVNYHSMDLHDNTICEYRMGKVFLSNNDWLLK